VITGTTYFCAGSSVTLTASDANATAGPLTYAWSDGSTAATSNPISTVGTYSVSITNGIGCTVSASQNTIRNMSSSIGTGTGVGAAVTGICLTTTSTSQTLSQKRIYNLSSTGVAQTVNNVNRTWIVKETVAGGFNDAC